MEAPWLSEVDSQALQQFLRDLDKAYKNFFQNPGKVGFPKFKSKHSNRKSYRTHNIAVVDNMHIAKNEKKLVREQRRLSRKQKESANREKQRVRVARVHEKIANQRKDTLHKFSKYAVCESQAIAVEDLHVKGMQKNHHLAKAVGDASMSEMIRQLAYKCIWYGREFVRVGRFYPSSKTCSDCGYVHNELTLTEREWKCPKCGKRHDRDLNAALNIALEGKRLLKGTAGLARTAA